MVIAIRARRSSRHFFGYYRFLSRLYFFLPVLVWYLLRRNMDLEEIGGALAVYGAASYMAEKVSRLRAWSVPWCLVVGEVIKGLGALALGISVLISGRVAFIILILLGEFLSGLGYGIANGKDSSIYHVLIGQSGAMATSFFANSSAVLFLSGLIAGIIGAVLSQISYLWPFALTVASCAINAIIATKLVNEFKEIKTESSLSTNKNEWTKKDSEVFIAIYYIVLRAVILGMFVLVVPYVLITTYAKTLSIVTYVLLLSAFSLSAYGTGILAGKLSYQFTTVLSFISNGLLVIGLGLYNVFGAISLIIFLPFFGAANGFIRPVFLSRVHYISGKNSDLFTGIVRKTESLYSIGYLIYLVLSTITIKIWSSNGTMIVSLCLIVMALFARFVDFKNYEKGGTQWP